MQAAPTPVLLVGWECTIGRPFYRTRACISQVGMRREPIAYANREVSNHSYLAREAGRVLAIREHCQPGFFCLSHRRWMSLQHLDPAGCAPRVPAAAMEDIDARILDPEHEPSTMRNVDVAMTLHRDRMAVMHGNGGPG